jgi:hypothetical protein
MQYHMTRSIGLVSLVVCLCAGCGGGGGDSGPAPVPAGVKVASRAMSLDPQGKVLASPVTVEMPYGTGDLNELGITDPSRLVVYQYDHQAGAWERVSGSTVDQGQSVVRFATTKLTMYRLAADTN